MADSKHLSRLLGVLDESEHPRSGIGDPIKRSLLRFRRQVRRRASAAVGAGFFHGLSEVAKMHPDSRPERHDVEVIRDIPYRGGGKAEHTLDIYYPALRPEPWPVVFYVHGGGFRLLSKDTHWVMGLAYARHGYLVVNISYRLAPRHRFPAAIEDTCIAYEWAMRNVARYGGDLGRVVVAGESAGGNLAAALTIATCYDRPEPWAQRAFATGVVPSVTVPACGMLEVSNSERFGQRRDLPFWVDDTLMDVSSAYLRGVDHDQPGGLDLADPLLVFERGDTPVRDLPAFFVPVGTKDPLLDDTRRLAAALDAMGVTCEAAYYEGEVHAFHALVWRRQARRCWRDTFAFLERNLRDSRPQPRPV